MKPSLLYAAWALLIDVQELGSFTAAAKKRNLAPSTVMRRLRALEEHVGTSLFLESPSGVRLTEAGLRAAAAVSQEFAVLQSTGERIEALPLTLFVDPRISLRSLIPIVSDTQRRHPVRLRVTQQTVAAPDAALTAYESLHTEEKRTEPIGYVPQTIVASPRYLTDSFVPAGPADLARHAQIRLHGSRFPGREVPDGVSALTVDDMDAGMDLAVQGCGIFPGADKRSAKPYLMAGQMSLVPVEEGARMPVFFSGSGDSPAVTYLRLRLAEFFAVRPRGER